LNLPFSQAEVLACTQGPAITPLSGIDTDAESSSTSFDSPLAVRQQFQSTKTRRLFLLWRRIFALVKSRGQG
jgi:hypothetical protein